MSSAAHGAHYKARSKKWLQHRGFTVFDMELVRVVYTPYGMVPSKRDQLGADLGFLARDVVVFVQVKGGVTSRTTLVRTATRAFAAYRFPLHSRRELHIWRPRAHDPEVIECP